MTIPVTDENKEKKISVVLPTYNGADYIHKSIESVIEQTYENWELIIVNDFSSDNTLDIITRYAENDIRIRIISNEENKKLPASLNIGFNVAKGSFLTWTSDDNAYHSNAFSNMIKVIDADPQIDLVYADYNIVNIKGDLIEYVKKTEPDEIRYNNNIGACFLYRKSLADKIGEYDTELFLAEDYEYWIRAYLNGKLVHINECLYDYALHEKSLTSTRREEISYATFLARSKHLEALLARMETEEERIRFFDQMLLDLTDRGERKKIRRHYYMLDPFFAIHHIKNRIVDKYYYLKDSFRDKGRKASR